MSVCEFQIVLPQVPLLQDMTSVQDTIASRWEKWFSDNPLLSIPTSEDDPVSERLYSSRKDSMY